jgi:DNA-binding transcriptional LysR family regulator
MEMDALTLDQFQVFVSVVEAGSFSAAARKLNRAQSAITYAIQNLEGQIAAELFDRTSYRPTLSEAGRVLLPQARRILADVGRFRASAREIARGVEPELRLSIVGGIPLNLLVPALSGFSRAFPSVQLRLIVHPFSMAVGRDATGMAVGEADIRILYDVLLPDIMERRQVAKVSLVAVAAATHPLARMPGPLDESLSDYSQIVMSELREAVAGSDVRVAAHNTWRVTDLSTQHALIRAGIGWGSLPDALVAEDIAADRIVRLPIADDSRFQPLLLPPIVAAHRRDEAPGPAGRWLLQRLGEQQSGSE